MNKIIIGRTKFIGCTLWSDISSVSSIVENMMNDYKNIYINSEVSVGRKVNFSNNYINKTRYIRPWRRLLSSQDVINYHIQMKNFLINEISNSDMETNLIVITHHAPSFKMLDISDNLSCCYGSYCDDLMVEPVKYWISGHTHTCKSVKIGSTLCLSNCMGYPKQKVDNYNPNRYIEFD